MNNVWTVYCHTNKFNGKKYFGITSKNPKKRWGNGRGYKHNNHFQSAIKKYSWDGFEHEIIATNLSDEEAKQMEIDLIAKYDTTNKLHGYNMTRGGDGSLGRYVSEETREKLRKAQTGKKASQETKRKMSDMRKGEKHPLYGKKRPSYIIDAMNKARVEKGRSKEAIEKTRVANMKPVLQIDPLSNVVIREFRSITEASQESGAPISNIVKVCQGNGNIAKGFKWQYKDEPYEYVPKSNCRKVAQIDLKSYSVVHIYDSIKEASEATGADRTSIMRVCQEKYKTANGFGWKYIGGD